MSRDFFSSLILKSYSQGSEQSNNPAIHSIQSLLLLVMPKSVKFSAWVWRRCLRWMSEIFVCTSACVSVCGPCACVRVCAAGSVRVRQLRNARECVCSRVWARIDSLCWIRLGKRRFCFFWGTPYSFLVQFLTCFDPQEVKRFSCCWFSWTFVFQAEIRTNKNNKFPVKFETSVF